MCDTGTEVHLQMDAKITENSYHAASSATHEKFCPAVAFTYMYNKKNYIDA